MTTDRSAVGDQPEPRDQDLFTLDSKPVKEAVSDGGASGPRDALVDPREAPGQGEAPARGQEYEIGESVITYEMVFEERKGKHWENYGTLSETRDPPEPTDTPKETGRLDAWHTELREPAEQRVTPFLKAFEEAGLVRLEGLEHRFKGTERLIEKVTERQADRPELTDNEALNNVFDSLRYTMSIPDDSYSASVREVMDGLLTSGYQLGGNGFKNFWDGATYKGINVQLRTPDGFPMELQFHTPSSFYVKEVLTHDLYERWREPNTSEVEIGDVDELQEDITSQIAVPNGALDLHYALPRKELP